MFLINHTACILQNVLEEIGFGRTLLVPLLDGPRGATGPLSPDEQEAVAVTDGGGAVVDGERHSGCRR